MARRVWRTLSENSILADAMKNWKRYSVVAVVTMACAVGATGCQSTKSKEGSALSKLATPWKGEKEPRKGVPTRIVGTWAEGVMHNAEVGGQRGFGGRLYFHDRAGTDPIRVEGQLVVYAFVEEDRIATDHRPTKRFVFPPEQFAKHESQSEIGVSYSFWLPWDSVVDAEQTEVSLIARFEPLEGGGLVVGDQTQHRLPGRPRVETSIAKQPSSRTGHLPATSAQSSSASSGVVTASHEGATTNTTNLSTTTISLPPGFQLGGSSSKPKSLRSQPTATPPITPQPGVLPTISPAAPAPATAPAGAQASSGLGLQHGTSVTLKSPGESALRGAPRSSFDFPRMTPPDRGLRFVQPASVH